jgi:hypothetical protein
MKFCRADGLMMRESGEVVGEMEVGRGEMSSSLWLGSS